MAGVWLSGAGSVLVKQLQPRHWPGLQSSKGLIVAGRSTSEMALWHSSWQKALVSHFTGLSIGLLGCFPDMAGAIPTVCDPSGKARRKLYCNGLYYLVSEVARPHLHSFSSLESSHSVQPATGKGGELSFIPGREEYQITCEHILTPSQSSFI